MFNSTYIDIELIDLNSIMRIINFCMDKKR